MIRFNWDIIKKYTKEDISKILEYFSNVYVLQDTMYNYLVGHKWAARIYNDEAPKNDYILSINELIANEENATQEEQYVYIDLASKRDIFTYYNTKGSVIFLPTWKIEKYYNINALKTNRLLTIDSDNIYLVYEGDN